MGRWYSAAQAAVDIMWHLVIEPEHGYSQGIERYGNDGRCMVESQGFTFTFPSGDRDCSWSVREVWNLALLPTKYKGALDGATYTGNMYDAFVYSGLFEPWYTWETIAQPGDVYLTHIEGGFQHTALCLSSEPDLLGEFSINEFGGIVGGRTGDQTGWESRACEYYDPGWVYTLHYNGKADFYMDDNYIKEIRDGLFETHVSDCPGDTSITSTKNRIDWIDYRVTRILENQERILNAIAETRKGE